MRQIAGRASLNRKLEKSAKTVHFTARKATYALAIPGSMAVAIGDLPLAIIRVAYSFGRGSASKSRVKSGLHSQAAGAAEADREPRACI
ncbi:MAG TPA: hypothetical protein VEB64_08565 [Azospirillaceae bacterium]|nr:hypothetical protein [Azospirillaceae bacterium]